MTDVDTGEARPGDEASAGMGERRIGPSWDERQAARTEAMVAEQVHLKWDQLGELLGSDKGKFGFGGDLMSSRMASWRIEGLADRAAGSLNDMRSSIDGSYGVVVWLSSEAARAHEGLAESSPNLVPNQKTDFEDGTACVYLPDHGYDRMSDQMVITLGGSWPTVEFGFVESNFLRIEGANGELWQNSQIDPDALERPEWISDL